MKPVPVIPYDDGRGTRPPSRRWMWIAAAALLMLVLAVGFALLQHQRAALAAERAQLLAKQRATQAFIQASAGATTSPTTRRGPTLNHRGEEVADEPSR